MPAARLDRGYIKPGLGSDFHFIIGIPTEEKTMDQDLNALCDRWLAAWSGNRPQELIEHYTEDVRYALGIAISREQS